MMALPRHLIDEVPIVLVFPVDLSLSLHPVQRKWLFQSSNCGRSPKLRYCPIGKETAESWYHGDISPYMD